MVDISGAYVGENSTSSLKYKQTIQSKTSSLQFQEFLASVFFPTQSSILCPFSVLVIFEVSSVILFVSLRP
ncbi:hypothetical protein K7X08_033673 [Anisodus acutangulus]|uniref:Uncharacterized protein n=1 Tax=Anisodus acutangulus TaxID=402998 RepID=A0A9Q1M4L0_9SOLA|nr:hypothetical protein K7X08_033673 [Anisodus acutangulus]